MHFTSCNILNVAENSNMFLFDSQYYNFAIIPLFIYRFLEKMFSENLIYRDYCGEEIIQISLLDFSVEHLKILKT